MAISRDVSQVQRKHLKSHIGLLSKSEFSIGLCKMHSNVEFFKMTSRGLNTKRKSEIGLKSENLHPCISITTTPPVPAGTSIILPVGYMRQPTGLLHIYLWRTSGYVPWIFIQPLRQK